MMNDDLYMSMKNECSKDFGLRMEVDIFLNRCGFFTADKKGFLSPEGLYMFDNQARTMFILEKGFNLAEFFKTQYDYDGEEMEILQPYTFFRKINAIPEVKDEGLRVLESEEFSKVVESIQDKVNSFQLFAYLERVFSHLMKNCLS